MQVYYGTTTTIGPFSNPSQRILNTISFARIRDVFFTCPSGHEGKRVLVNYILFHIDFNQLFLRV